MSNSIKPIANNIFVSILEQICAKDDMREWMSRPFNASGKSMATNGYTLVATPMCGFFDSREDNVKSVYPFEKNIWKLIAIQEIKEKLALFPTVDCFDKEEQQCNACYGSGSVDFEFDYGSNTYHLDGECPVCEGEGITAQKSKIPNGKKEFDYTKLFQIGVCAFNVNRINELIYVAEQLQKDTVLLIHQTLPNKPTAFLIGEVELLLMPSVGLGDDVLQSIA